MSEVDIPKVDSTPGEIPNAAGGPDSELPSESEFPEASAAAKFGYILKEILITVLLFLALRNFIVQARFIPSESMVPGLQIGDRLLVELVTRHLGNIDRGDIIVFYKPGALQPNVQELLKSSFGLHDDHAMIKRVIGMPGDVVEVMPSVGVKINGQLLEENYVAEVALGYFPAQTVPPGHYFMMGDNRNRSADSRSWGMLPAENIIGRAFVKFYPFNRLGGVN